MTSCQRATVEAFLGTLRDKVREVLLGRRCVIAGWGTRAKLAESLAAQGLAKIHPRDSSGFRTVRLTLDMEDPWVLEQLWALGEPP